MRRPVLNALLPAALAAAGLAALAGWLRVKPGVPLALRLPAPRPAAPETRGPQTDIEGAFARGDGSPSSRPGAWPRFRGAGFDNVSRSLTRLAGTWPPQGPPLLWSVALGDGHAGPAVLNGRVYVLDHDAAAASDVLRCLSLDDGREIWRRGYRVPAKNNHGISRTVPAVTDRHVVTLGPRCHVLCVDAASGAFRWGIDLVQSYGTKEPLWYAAQCPLIDGNLAVLAPAGRVLMTAIDCDTGAVAWETPNPGGWAMSHASIVPMTHGGRRMFVYAALGGVAAVAADGPDAGALLWTSTDWNNPVTAPSPVVLPGGRLLLTAGYGAGSILLQVREEDGRFRAETVRRFDTSVFACEQHTPVLHRDHLFTVMPNDAGALRRQLVCMDLSGAMRWSSGKTVRFGLGPFLVADGKLLVLDDAGRLTMAEASTDAWVPLAEHRVLDGPDAWGPMALADGRLLLRDLRRMICLDLRAQSGEPEGP